MKQTVEEVGRSKNRDWEGERERERSSLFHESAFLDVGFAKSQGVRVQEGTGVPSICWDIGHVIFAILQQAPIVPDVVSARRATPDSHNGDGVFLHTHTHTQTHI